MEAIAIYTAKQHYFGLSVAFGFGAGIMFLFAILLLLSKTSELRSDKEAADFSKNILFIICIIVQTALITLAC